VAVRPLVRDRQRLARRQGREQLGVLERADDPEVAAAVTVSGSGSFRVWRFTEEGWS